MCPSKSQLEKKPITVNPPPSSNVYSTDGSTHVPAKSLAFLPMRNPTVSGDHCRSKSLIVSRTYSAEPGNEWVIPNRIITEKNGKSYVPILNPSVQSVVFPAGKEIPGVEAIESTEWVTVREEVKGNFSSETSPPRSIPEFLRESLEKVPAEYRQEMETLLTRYQDLFHDTPLKSTNAAEHETDAGDHQPIRSAPYQVSELEREAINTQVEAMLQAVIVKPSSVLPSSWYPRKTVSSVFALITTG
ncbi:uncharacterized protein LOC124189015 [Daphnia pulex]|uniref:uncharacterized protein LOC124189015 n=1 Tax=Daphnia pulex TaxID=6669 RepID=UPI001EDF58B8|nr:uncharacterized protein LOC124189015 [Daphnia pulex]